MGKILSRLLFIGILIFLSACQNIDGQGKTQSVSPERILSVERFDGSVEYKSANNWQPVSKGMQITEGTSIRTGSDSNIYLVANDETTISIGYNTLLEINTISSSLSNPETSLYLEQGSILVSAQQDKLGSGYATVENRFSTVSMTGMSTKTKRPNGLSSKVALGSGYVGSYIVTIVDGKTPEEAKSKTGMVTGNGTLTLPGNNSTTSLQLEKYYEIDHQSDIVVYPGSLIETAAELGIMDISWLYAHLTSTPAASQTPSTTPSVTPARPTWTPFPSAEIPTENSSSPDILPTHIAFTPEADWTPQADGLTPQESANSGRHHYSGKGMAFGDCIFTGADADQLGDITFTSSSVILSSSGGTGGITYSKVGPNVYTVEEGEMVAIITFFMDGFDLDVTKGGKDCSKQVFTLN